MSRSTALFIVTAALICAVTSEVAGSSEGDSLQCEELGKLIDGLKRNISVLLDSVVAPCMEPVDRTGRCQMSEFYGGTSGQSFNEFFGCLGVKITGFKVRHGPYIHGLQFFYDVNGTRVSGSIFGSFTVHGATTDHITLNSDEKIVGISGFHGDVISRLKFFTDQGRLLGPFGKLHDDDNFDKSNCNELRGIFGTSLNYFGRQSFGKIGFYCVV